MFISDKHRHLRRRNCEQRAGNLSWLTLANPRPSPRLRRRLLSWTTRSSWPRPVPVHRCTQLRWIEQMLHRCATQECSEFESCWISDWWLHWRSHRISTDHHKMGVTSINHRLWAFLRWLNGENQQLCGCMSERNPWSPISNGVDQSSRADISWEHTQKTGSMKSMFKIL